MRTLFPVRTAHVLFAISMALPVPLTAQGLRVRTGGSWVAWWSADAAPAQWSGPDARLAGALAWKRTAAAGLRWGDATLSGDGEAWRIRLIVLELDPAQVQLRLVGAKADDPAAQRSRWRIGEAPRSAVAALNAGQFTAEGPWGWLVRDGRELRTPGRGPLAMAFAVDTLGRPHFAAGDSMEALRRSGIVRLAFQSYPVLLEREGQVPFALRDTASLVRLRHRDARLAIGRRRDGTLLIAMTRFEGAGGVLEMVPFGLTTPEMAGVMGALGCEQAMLLDGGISSQMLGREAGGATQRWPGLRAVPLGLVVEPKGRAAGQTAPLAR